MSKEVMEFVFSSIFVKIAKVVTKAVENHPEKEDEIQGSIVTAISKTAEFGKLHGIEYDNGKIVFKFDGVNLVADLQQK